MNNELIYFAQDIALTTMRVMLLQKGVDDQVIKEAIIDAKSILHHDAVKRTQKEEVPAI